MWIWICYYPGGLHVMAVVLLDLVTWIVM